MYNVETERRHFALCYSIWIFPFNTDIKAAWLLQSEYTPKLTELLDSYIFWGLHLCQNSALRSTQCTMLTQNGDILHYVTVYEYSSLIQVSKQLRCYSQNMQKIRWITSQLDLLRLQTLPKFDVAFNSLYHAETERRHLALFYSIWIFQFNTDIKAASLLQSEYTQKLTELFVSYILWGFKLCQNSTLRSTQCTMPKQNGDILLYVTVYEYPSLIQISNLLGCYSQNMQKS